MNALASQFMAPRRVPPGPKGSFLSGNLPELSKDLLGFFTMCARQYGPIVQLRLGNMPALLLNDPGLIEYVLVTNNRNFIKHTFFWRHVTAVFGDGLLTSEGKFWVRQRQLIQPAFHRERIAAYSEVMVDYTKKMLDTWQDQEVRDVHQDMMHLTSKIVAMTLFGAQVERDVEAMTAAFEVITEEFAVRFRRLVRIPDWVPTPNNLRYRKAVSRLDEVIYGIIRQRRVTGRDSWDLLSILLHAQDEEGSRMTDQQLRDETITLFLAGQETTALVLSWTWYLLEQYPTIEAKLWEELRSVLGDWTPTIADLPRLPYAEMVVKESMRLYPPAYTLGREALQECEIGGYQIPAKTTLFMSQWVMHRDPRYFDRPEEFNPDRWGNDLAKRLPAYAYFPFGGGPRHCIGHAFAMTEAVLLLATIAQRFHFTLVPEHPIQPYPSITLRPRYGIRMVLSKR